MSALARIGGRTGYLEEVNGDSFRFPHDLIRKAIEEVAIERGPELLRETVELREEARDEEESDLVLADLYQRAGVLDRAIDEVGIAAMNASVYGFPSEVDRLALWQDSLLERLGWAKESEPRLEAAELRAEALYSAHRFQEVVDFLRPLEIPAYRQRRPQLLFLLGAARSRLSGTITLGEALESLQRALEVASASKNASLVTYLHLGMAKALRGRDEGRARRSFFRAVQVSNREKGSGLGSSVLRQARLFLEPEAARHHAEQAIDLAEREGRHLTEAFALNNLGAVLVELGLLTDAEESYSRCLRMLGAKGRWGMAVPLNNLALLALYRGDGERAADYFDAASLAAETCERLVAVRCNRARLTAQDNAEEAVQDLRRVLSINMPIRQDLRSAAKFNLGRALLEVGRSEEALQEAKSAHRGSDRIGTLRLQPGPG